MVEVLAAGSRVAVGSFFVLSALAKFHGSGATVRATGALGIPTSLQLPLVRTLATLELTLGVLLLVSPVNQLAVLAATAAMVVLLTGALLALSRRAPTLSCGCLGDLGTGSHSVAVVRNCTLLVFVAIAALRPNAGGSWSYLLGAELAVLVAVGSEGLGTVRSVASYARRLEVRAEDPGVR
jgi:hypothetical protein